MKTRWLGLAPLLPAMLGLIPALAWGYEGHEIIADIDRSYLTSQAGAQVDALAADTLTAPDMTARAPWAGWRGAAHGETASWHFVYQEPSNPDLPPSSGPAQDCVTDRIQEFTAERGDAATLPEERRLTLKDGWR